MKWLKYLVAFLVPIVVVLCFNHGLDNDSWDVLAEGRYIAENGIYHEDVLSMHEGFHTAVQNYSFAVIFYWIHSALGAPGIYLAMLMLNLLILYLLYKVFMIVSDKNVKLSLILMVVTDVVLAFGFIVTRAQMLDYVVFLVLIYVLELFIKTDKSKYLWWIPILSIFLANFHASVWWIIFAIMLTYIIDGFRKPKRFLQGYRLKPLILVFLVSAVAGLLNPFGIEMVTSIFSIFGEMAGLNYVIELQSFNPLSGICFVMYLALIGALTLYIFAKERIRMRYLLMFFGFLTMGLVSIKGMSELLLVMFIPVAYLYRKWQVPKVFANAPKVGRATLVSVTILLVCVTVGCLVIVLPGIQNRPSIEMEEAMDAIDLDVGDKNKRDMKVYVGYNQGGYVEYRGYPAYLDPRGADFMKSVNGKEDVLQEWVDLRERKITIEDFLDKYKFDYLLVENGEGGFENFEDERYELLYGGEDSPVTVYKKKF